MITNERWLRIIQVAMILFLVFCYWVKSLIAPESKHLAIVFTCLILLGAFETARVGFKIQQLFNRVKDNPRLNAKGSTPFSRWMAGNILRLATSFSVSMWGFSLHILGGPYILVDALFVASLLLLLIWKPCASPPQIER